MKSLSDINAPMPVKRKLLEKDVQKRCVDWARARGYWARKFSSQSQRSVPDFLFSHPAKIKFACEFKAPGKTSTDAQIDEQTAMREAGWFVFECDHFANFQTQVLWYELECM